MLRRSGSYNTKIRRGSFFASMCRTMLRIGAMPVSPARKTTSRVSSSGRRKLPYGPSTAISEPAFSRETASPPFPCPTRTQSCTACGRSGADAMVYARETPSGKRKFTHCPGLNVKPSSLNEIVSWSTFGASSSISVTMAPRAITTSTPHARLGELRDFLEDAVLLETAEVIDEEHAVEVIDLVAHRACHQSVSPHLPLDTVAVEEAQLDALRTRDHLDK